MCLTPIDDKVLDVRGNGLGASGLVGLSAFFKSQPTLKVLDLAGNNLGDEGLDAIITSLSPTPPPSASTANDASSGADVLDVTASTYSSRNSSRPTSRDGRGNEATATMSSHDGEGSGSMADSPNAGAEEVPVAASLEELRLTTNGFGEAPVLRLLKALTDSR